MLIKYHYYGFLPFFVQRQYLLMSIFCHKSNKVFHKPERCSNFAKNYRL